MLEKKKKLCRKSINYARAEEAHFEKNQETHCMKLVGVVGEKESGVRSNVFLVIKCKIKYFIVDKSHGVFFCLYC